MKRIFLSLASLAAATVVSPAMAQTVDCSTLTNPLYIQGSSAAKPFVKALGAAISTTTTVVYASSGSCTGGVNSFVGDTTGATAKMPATGSYFTMSTDDAGAPTVKENTCTIPTATATDIGLSDVFPASCAGMGAVPATVGDFYGPNQVMTFVVPKASNQSVISADAAYLVFGFGAAGKVTPWVDDTQVFVRGSGSGTQTMLGAAIGVPSTKWFNNATTAQVASNSQAMITKVASATAANAALGILASTDADGVRDTIKILAYQHQVPGKANQTCSYLPDSSATSFDKANVRDGHYPVWGPLHLLATVDGSGVVTKASAKTFIGYFTDPTTVPTGVNLLDLEIAAHTVPACAMKVKRTTELGDVTAFSPAGACGCYFEKKATGTAPASCKTCTTATAATDCGAGASKCNYGYCEAN